MSISFPTDAKARRAKDAFQDTFTPLLESMIFNLTVLPIEKSDGSYSLSVKCQFEDLERLSRRRKEAFLDLFCDGFEFEGITYPVSVVFVRVPDSLQE
jgi:hypothetical protein